ncbi:MAG: peptidoglycan DD-metalloendopeptidase family protein, partial [Anaerolineae bacterium]
MSSFKFEAWPTEYRSINQYFGANPQNYQQFGLPGHEGLDIMAPTGSKIYAVAPGKISRVYPHATGHNYGIHVRIDHVDGYQTIYAHLQRALVRVGQSVAAGEQIGLADDTGNSFGSHLHLTLKKKGAQQGNWPYNIIDPTPFILTLMGWQRPAGPFTDGWAYTDGIFAQESIGLAQVGAGGINLREQPSVNAKIIDLVPAETIIIVTGGRRGLYTPVQVPTSALSHGEAPPPPPPDPPPPSTVSTVDGWGWRNYLSVSGTQAVVGQYGINLRQEPNRSGANIGLVQGRSTVTVLGEAQGDYLPVRVRRQDFMGAVNLPEKPPAVTPGDPTAPANSYLGWAWTRYLTITGTEALVGRFGINLRSRPSRSGQNIGLLKGGATATIVGQAEGEYTPVAARMVDVLNAASPMPAIQQPTPLSPTEPTPPPTLPPQDTTPGWAFSTQLTVSGSTAVSGPYGINLRNAPRRNGENIGFIPANTELIITGAAQGEYTPVRVDDAVLQPPFGTVPAAPPTTTPAAPAAPAPAPPTNPDPPSLGQVKIGLHASADP